jgi:hypothetical protein
MGGAPEAAYAELDGTRLAARAISPSSASPGRRCTLGSDSSNSFAVGDLVDVGGSVVEVVGGVFDAVS